MYFLTTKRSKLSTGECWLTRASSSHWQTRWYAHIEDRKSHKGGTSQGKDEDALNFHQASTIAWTSRVRPLLRCYYTRWLFSDSLYCESIPKHAWQSRPPRPPLAGSICGSCGSISCCSKKPPRVRPIAPPASPAIYTVRTAL